MKTFFRFFAERHILAILFTVMIILLGVKTLVSINRSQFPNIDLGYVSINTRYPGASPEDVELNVTNKIESELQGVSGIKKMTSVSMENVSYVGVELKPDVPDSEKVKTEIREAVSRITDFPLEVTEAPLISEEKTSIFPIIEVGITGNMPYTELRKISRRFEKKLKSIPSVAGVTKYGYRAREIHIEVMPDKMRQYQIPMHKIIQAIQTRNIKATGGTLESFTSEKNVVTLAQFRYPLEVGDVIVHTTPEGSQIKVNDLAIIKDDFEDERFFARLNGKKAISFVVKKSETGDVIRTVAAIKKLAKETEEKYDNKIKILYVSDVSKNVKNQFRIVITNGIIGLSLVLIVLAVFLNIRMAFWVAAGIPISLLGTTYLLPVFGVNLDSITLTSMVLVIGIIVDDAVIISENIYKRRELGDEPVDAAVNGLYEVFLPVMTTVLTTFVVFAPMFFMPGMLGKFIFVIPLTVILALVISLAESIIALPSHLVPGLKKITPAKEKTRKAQWIESFIKTFEKKSRSMLKLRYVWLVVAIFLLAASLFYAKTNMGFILFSSKGAESFSIDVELPLGTSLAGTSEKLREIENIISTLPEDEVESYAVRIGATGGILERENVGIFVVQLSSFNSRERSADEIVEWLRVRTDVLEGYDEINYDIETSGPPTGEPVEIRVIGPNDMQRSQLTDSLTEFLVGVEGVKDIKRDDKSGKEQIRINLDYGWLARYGLTVSDVAQNVRIAYDGQVVTNVRYGEEDVDFRVEIQQEYRKSLEYLNELLIPNNRGELIKLKKVADLQPGPGPSSFRHFKGDRAVTIEADIDQKITTPVDVVNAVKAHFNTDLDFPEVELSFGGEAQESNEAMIDLIMTFGVALIGMYFLLTLLFNSFAQPLLVMFTIPFGIISVIFALAIHGEPFTFLAMIGTVGLAGVVVNDALVLVNHINFLRKKEPDKPIIHVVAQGTSDRLRPILLTTISTVVGLIPLAYGLGGMDVYMAPMALTLGYGLLFATPLTLLLIPCFYIIGIDIAGLFKRERMV